jgi:hypothetical protein
MAGNIGSFLLLWLAVALVQIGESFQFHHQKRQAVDPKNEVSDVLQVDRKNFFKGVGMAFFAVAAVPKEALAVKSYSSNARNLDRINSGDMSGGSVYDNNPTSEAGQKRRAMVGCKSSVAREEAAQNSLNHSNFSEKECNKMVLAGETDFMLQALRTLDCPSCPYGISSRRN